MILKDILLPPAVLLHSLLIQLNARFANTRAQCGAFLDMVNEMTPLELSEDMSITSPVSGQELSSEGSPSV